jgi:transcriptional regulator with XRE-family HTH domain
MPGVADLMWQLLPRLRAKSNLTVPELSEITRDNGERVPANTIAQYELKSRAGLVPKAYTLRALARALGVKPEDFYEYPIAVAQEQRGEDAARAAEEAADEIDRRGRHG